GTVEQIPSGDEIVKGIAILERQAVFLVAAVVIEGEKGLWIRAEIGDIGLAEKLIGEDRKFVYPLHGLRFILQSPEKSGAIRAGIGVPVLAGGKDWIDPIDIVSELEKRAGAQSFRSCPAERDVQVS